MEMCYSKGQMSVKGEKQYLVKLSSSKWYDALALNTLRS